MVVGADRIAANGDTANKIGTYSVAVLAHENEVPFYVAAPLSTVDLSLPDGAHIPIEERAADRGHPSARECVSRRRAWTCATRPSTSRPLAMSPPSSPSVEWRCPRMRRACAA